MVESFRGSPTQHAYAQESFRGNAGLDGNPETSPVCDSYAEFMCGAYKVATFDHPCYREIGQDPVTSGPQTVRTTINETVDGSVNYQDVEFEMGL